MECTYTVFQRLHNVPRLTFDDSQLSLTKLSTSSKKCTSPDTYPEHFGMEIRINGEHLPKLKSRF